MKYVFTTINLSGQNTELIAHAVDIKIHGTEDLVDSMYELDHNTPKHVIRDVLETQKKAACGFIEKGEGLRTSLFTIKPAISGKVKDAAHVTSASLTTKVNISPSPALMKAAEKLPLELDTTRAVGPRITSVFTAEAENPRTMLASGKILNIRGVSIKVTGDDPSVGVYFKNTKTGALIKAQAVDPSLNTSSKVVVITPKLPRGQYFAQIVTQFTGRGNTRVPPLTITYNTPLAVK